MQPQQPPKSNLSLKGLLSLPYRLCNPPPAVGKVRSCGVTPVLDVRLDDILERKHLPPLGLKDFEEYLLYVEQSPENLYFLLWLKEYNERYHAWTLRAKATHSASDASREPNSPRNAFRVPPAPDPALALFYARAKQTFFTPNGQYELNVPSDILAPFHSSSSHSAFSPCNRPAASHWHSQNTHPDPAAFTEVALEARNMLKDSLALFVRAAYTNVGSRRAACGIAAGSLFILLCGVLPLALMTGGWAGAPHGRLVRLAAFPGLWLGLTVLIASLHGVCLMVYIFGDLRQLRKFELARPAISRPIPVAEISSISAPLPCRPRSSNTRLPQALEKDETPVSPVTINSEGYHSFHVQERSSSPAASSSCSSGTCDTCDSSSSFEPHDIDISPAYFDPIPAPEGPATSTALYRSAPSSIAFPPSVHARPRPDPSPLAIATSFAASSAAAQGITRGKSTTARTGREFGPTAGFIPHDSDSDSDTHHGNHRRRGRVANQRQCGEQERFDFDLLPKATAQGQEYANAAPVLARSGGEKSLLPGATSPSSSRPISSVLGRAQYKCNKRPYAQSPVSSSSEPSLNPHSPASRPTSYFGMTLTLPSFTAGVPAFAAPMTRVRSPVVVRAQWEVVVRAAVLAALGAGVVVGVVVGVVP
ncbi:hypothetical protein BV22DRAFT_1102854 [Leucogyrophana mollusca]|uniref:Uncharacterized protein n=1 Tax=Leucogyrophana mollusca TaxID=85980 RepID=A0ACB8BU47_9AGAM|nr:hypothetical protein BV22DRAFT_1102854 [Leucogyrophana mollusca]